MTWKLRNAALASSTFIVLVSIWQIIATSGAFPSALFPDLRDVASTLLSSIWAGTLIYSTLGTLARLGVGFALAVLVGLPLGAVMGRYKPVEDFFLPLVSIAYPIPALAYAPLFVLWFGLGSTPSVLLVMVAAALQIAINTWKGGRAVKSIWLRSAEVMGAGEARIFWYVVLPGSLPYVMSGLRIGLGAAWRVLVGVEMITAVSNGLGSMIFGAAQFLRTDIMLSGVIVIGVIGVLLEKQIFERIERRTLMRWGMMAS